MWGVAEHACMAEEAWFRGDRISRMVDTIPAEEIAKLRPHFERYGAEIAKAQKEKNNVV